MEKNRKNRLMRTLGGGVMITAILLALAGCAVAVESGDTGDSGNGGILYAPTVNATQGYYPTTVSLAWTGVAGAGSYNYYYATNASGPYQYLGNTTAKSAGIIVPYSSASYFFKVSAISYSNVEGARSLPALGWAYLSTAPIIYATTNLTGQIVVSWNPVNDAVGYNVYDMSGTKIYLGKGVLDASGAYYYYVDTVYPGTFYYKVESIYADNGISPLSTEVGGRAY